MTFFRSEPLVFALTLAQDARDFTASFSVCGAPVGGLVGVDGIHCGTVGTGTRTLFTLAAIARKDLT